MKQSVFVIGLFLVSVGSLGCQRHTPQARAGTIELSPAVIAQIQYRGMESVTQSDIVDRFKERNVNLSFGEVDDPAEIKKAQGAIKELLSERGHKFAVVNATYEDLPSNNAVRLVFTVAEGKKSR